MLIDPSILGWLSNCYLKGPLCDESTMYHRLGMVAYIKGQEGEGLLSGLCDNTCSCVSPA